MCVLLWNQNVLCFQLPPILVQLGRQEGYVGHLCEKNPFVKWTEVQRYKNSDYSVAKERYFVNRFE